MLISKAHPKYRRMENRILANTLNLQSIDHLHEEMIQMTDCMSILPNWWLLFVTLTDPVCRPTACRRKESPDPPRISLGTVMAEWSDLAADEGDEVALEAMPLSVTASSEKSTNEHFNSSLGKLTQTHKHQWFTYWLLLQNWWIWCSQFRQEKPKGKSLNWTWTLPCLHTLCRSHHCVINFCTSCQP